MLSISEKSELRMVEGSGHSIPREKPDAVVRAVNDMVRELRTKGR